MLRQITVLILLAGFLSGFHGTQAIPVPLEDDKAGSGSETVQTPWKLCPTYGSFHGDVVADSGCCLDEHTCSVGIGNSHQELPPPVEDNKLSSLVRTKRFKRSVRSGDLSGGKYQYIFGSSSSARSSGDEDDSNASTNELMEVSLCESKAELIRPAFGTVYGTRKPVQIYQLEPFLVQSVIMDRCVEQPTTFLHGECRQRYEPQEMFIVSRNASDVKGVGIDRVFVAVPMGCSTFIDPTQILHMLSLQKEASSNKDKMLIKSTAGTSVNYQSYSLNNKPISQDFRDMTISDQPSQQASGVHEEDSGKVDESNLQKLKPGTGFGSSSQTGESEDKVLDEQGRDSHDLPTNDRLDVHNNSGANRGTTGVNFNNAGTTSNTNRTGGSGNDSDSGKRGNSSSSDNNGTGGETSKELENSSNSPTGGNRNDEPNRFGNNVQNVSGQIKVPVYFGSSSLLDPVQQFLNSRETNIIKAQ